MADQIGFVGKPTAAGVTTDLPPRNCGLVVSPLDSVQALFLFDALYLFYKLQFFTFYHLSAADKSIVGYIKSLLF